MHTMGKMLHCMACESLANDPLAVMCKAPGCMFPSNGHFCQHGFIVLRWSEGRVQTSMGQIFTDATAVNGKCAEAKYRSIYVQSRFGTLYIDCTSCCGKSLHQECMQTCSPEDLQACDHTGADLQHSVRDNATNDCRAVQHLANSTLRLHEGTTCLSDHRSAPRMLAVCQE